MGVGGRGGGARRVYAPSACTAGPGPEGGAEVCEPALCVRLHSTGRAQAEVHKQCTSCVQAAMQQQRATSVSAVCAHRTALVRQTCMHTVGRCTIRCSGSVAVAKCEWWVCGLAKNHPLRVAAAQRDRAPRRGRTPHAVHGRGHTHQGRARRPLSCLAGGLCFCCLAGSLCLRRCGDTSRLRFLQ